MQELTIEVDGLAVLTANRHGIVFLARDKELYELPKVLVSLAVQIEKQLGLVGGKHVRETTKDLFR